MGFNARIGDIAEVVMGQSPQAEDVNSVGIGFPLLNGPTEFTTRCPVPVQYTTAGKKFAENGDILFCVRGSTTGRMNYADQKYVIGRGIAAIHGKNGYPTQYVRAVIERNLDRLLAAATGSTFPNIGRDQLLNYEVETVSPEDATEVNKLIVSLEDKIELNRQINQTLEQIAQTIFKSWFVDFEPVKAKIEAKAAGRDPERAAMCAISGKLEPELDQLSPEQYQQLAATAALFPDELVESELGLIPVGWEVKSLAEMVQLTGGGTPKRSNPEFWGGDIPWFSVQDAPADGDVFVVDTEEKITKIGLEKSSTRLLPVGTTIISARGTVGRLALVGVEMAMNQSCYGVEGADEVGPYFNYFNLKGAVSTLQQNTHGAVFDTITRQTFETVSCVKPTKPVLEHFEVILAPMMETMRSNVVERRILATLRDILLPKLLSGELRVIG